MLAIFFCVLFAPAVFASSPEDIVRAFVQRYAGGELRGAAQLWMREQRTQFERKHARILAVRCMRIEELEVAAVDESTVDTVATFAYRNLSASRQRFVRRHFRYRLRLDGDTWRIAEWIDREEELADAVAAAPDATQREALLRERAAWWGAEAAEALTVRAVRLVNQNQLARARELTRLARDVAGQHGDDRLLAFVTGTESIIARREKNHDVALAAAEESVRLARTSGDPDLEVRAFVRWVRAAREVDQDRQIDFAPALALAESVEDLSAGALVATHGSVYMHYRGRLRESFELGLLAHRLAEQSGDVPSQISGLQNIAGSYLSTGDAALAQSYFERAYDLAVRAGFHVVTVSALTAIAECLFVTGNKEAAHQLDAESACELERAGEWFNASTVRSRMVNHHIAEGDLDAAERELAHAQRDAANAHAQARSAVWDQAEAPLRLAQGRYREALEAMDSSVEYPSASVRQLRARILSALGRFEEAEYELLLSLQDIEIMRAEVVAEPRQLRHFMGNWSGVYAQLTDLLADCGRTDEALAMAESLRANVLRDVLAGGAVGSTSAGDGAERRRLAETEARLVRLNRQASSRRPEHLRHAIELTRLELADLSARIAAAHPESPRRELPTPASRSGDTLYLSYTVTEQRTLVLLTRGTRVERTVFLPVARKELEAKVARFARQLERRDLNAVASARDLYRVLLQPLQPELGRARRICIVPDGELWRVPFHALRAPGGRWLAELATISYAPSVTLGITLSGASPRRDSSILLLGDASGSLPAANDEVRRVAALYGSRAALFADRATEAAFKAEAGRHETIHIAAHAEIDRGSPMYSAVVVSPGAEDEDGRIEARELAQLDLRDKLVVLSACATATGETRTAEGIVGLPWALMAAGARESVLSAWNVDSAATASLMDAFHRHLLQSPSRPAAEALRRAQLELLRRPEYSHPYYWAAFQVIGGQ